MLLWRFLRLKDNFNINLRMSKNLNITANEIAFYTSEQRASVDINRIPKHVAIIPDGSRRWAKKNDAKVAEGHQNGADILMDIVRAAKEISIKVITFYIFSTENWNRDEDEVQALLWLLESYLIDQQPTMINNGVRLQTIGDLSRFPDSVKAAINSTKEKTQHCKDIEMVFALNYGGRDEISRAFKLILEDYDRKNIEKSEINEKVIARYLDSAKWADPDLLIRTSGEFRMSNFLLWQSSYAEFYTINVLWPDFTPEHLLKAILDYQRRERRMGGA